MIKNSLWPVETYYFKNEIIDNNKIKEILLEKEKSEPGRILSNMGGWQSEGSILEENDFSEIKDFLLECLTSIKNEIYRDDVDSMLAQSWASVNRCGHYNLEHVHAGSHWSCAYYVTETYGAPLFFCDPSVRKSMDTSYGFLKNKYFNKIGSGKMPGEVVFFPSWLEHGVAKNSTDNPRISISCNFIMGILIVNETKVI